MDENTTPPGSGRNDGYRVLARKYRPADFGALIGQEPMVRTLTNAFATGRIAQGWMLTGVRGVGKTTTARILARALNYKTDAIDQPSVDLSVPGVHCQAIMEGRHVDVIEMDAASHTGIDDIREIIEQVRYAPVSARYKVYIIDEVHMLSTQAFNGLLKTLEEPPPHVKFIFATTEIRKVPITVLSRCQRFDLRRVAPEVLVAHLTKIAGLEGISCDEAALAMIARAAEGSVRDSLSILDQAIAHGGGTVTADAVRTMLGLADRARVVDLFEHVMRGDMPAALGEFRTQYDGGADPATVLVDLAEFTHFVTRLRFVPSAADDASLTDVERKRGSQFADALPLRTLSRAWQMLLKGITEVQSSNRPVSAAEMVLIRLAHAADLPPLDEVVKGIEDGSRGPAGSPSSGSDGGGRSAPGPRAALTSGGGASMAVRLVSQNPVQTAQPVEARAPQDDAVPIRSLADIIALADERRDITFKVQLRRYVRPVRIEPGHLEVALTPDAPTTLIQDTMSRLRAWTGRSWLVSLSRETGGQTLAEQEASRRETAILDASNDPTVAAILARFPGAKVIDVRIPDAADAAADDDIAPGDSMPAGDPSGDDDN
jgi:DNA polymerase-3 subunit gamma/tau